jgi:NADH-quinone oxidoreductase subunit G
VPFYGGLTLEELGGRGVRWPGRSAATLPAGKPVTELTSGTAGAPVSDATAPAAAPRPPKSKASQNGHLRVGTYRSIWAAPEVEISPALQFTRAEQLVELSPADAERLGIMHGEAIRVSQNGTTLSGRAAVRTGVPEGTAFLATGIAADAANQLTEPLVEVSKG